MGEDNDFFKFIIAWATLIAFIAIVGNAFHKENTREHERIELEKYKIEMQYKHGDVVEENK